MSLFTNSFVKQGSEIGESDRIRIKSGNGASVLCISNIQPDQTGKYTVEVMNSQNRNEAAASVTVESTPDPPSGKPVSFVTKKKTIFSYTSHNVSD